MWFAQKKVISKLADKGDCVIVGRCAYYILCDTAEYSMQKKGKRIVNLADENLIGLLKRNL